MARYDDIALAYRQSIKIDPRGRRTVTTVDFVQALARYNHIWTLRQANFSLFGVIGPKPCSSYHHSRDDIRYEQSHVE